MLNEYNATTLDEICKRSLDANLKIRGTTEATLLDDLTRDIDPASTSALDVAFTYFAVNFFAGVVYQLASDLEVHSAFKGNSAHLQTLTERSDIFFRYKNARFVNDEYLLDFYAHAGGQKLCPVVTMESEARPEGEAAPLADLDKLLSVSSPRRIYLGRCSQRNLAAVEAAVARRLDAAYASQIVLRGDQIELLFLVSGKAQEVRQYSFDAHSRMRRSHVTHAVATAP